ncbi:unnamed protein product [Allacma fusca]|uniref:Uncharacterized protein n=1 Tax=Allacma fusca TaxID=39272 RepID=A0A8J2L3U4_9HEXA|nr:unnamed protein product [Allacma fusca]
MTTKLTCAIAGPSIVPGDFDVWAGEILQVPPCVPSGLGGACNLMDVNYELKVEMLGRGLPCLGGSIPIVIGVRPPTSPMALRIVPTIESPPSYEMAIVCSDNMRTTDDLPMDTLDIQPPAYFP